MSSGTQVDLDWAGPDAAQGGAAASPAGAQETGAVGGAYLTDEEILGIEPNSGTATTHQPVILSARPEDSRRGEAKNLSSIEGAGEDATKRDSSGKDGPQNDNLKEPRRGTWRTRRCRHGWRRWRRIRSMGARRSSFGGSIRSFARRLLLRRRRARSRSCCLEACGMS